MQTCFLCEQSKDPGGEKDERTEGYARVFLSKIGPWRGHSSGEYLSSTQGLAALGEHSTNQFFCSRFKQHPAFLGWRVVCVSKTRQHVDP